MANLIAYLKFNGNCREAMEFYKECFGGVLEIMTVKDSPMMPHTPAEMQEMIMHSFLKSKNLTLMASDMMGKEDLKQGNTVSLTLVCESKEEIGRLFEKLSKGAKINQELKEEFFGTYANLIDKFGFDWMLQFGEKPKI